ncbi:MAG: cell envelope integrity protein TolA, partial [Alphaproteobacteria bacterium]|nr:cell envelope integrity protein TolA [Alphaproteobacteria bacterium]
SNQPNPTPELHAVIEKILDQFKTFPSRINDLLHFSRSRSDLEDILIRFLVSLNAYTEDFFRLNIQQLDTEAPEGILLSGFEEGGHQLTHEERYIAARFVKDIVSTQPEFVPYLVRLASIGLLTEVVDDFVKPTARAENSNLAIFLDAPMAQHYLGLSGYELQAEVRSVLDSLKAIGCQLMMFPESCNEIARNLSSMLALTFIQRHGYTHEAMRRGQVSEEYVIAVRNNPEKAVEDAGISIRNITIEKYPNLHPFFPAETYEDFLAAITWVQEVAPREHDAKCMTMIMRLREGRSSADLFGCRYVFATNNPAFAKKSRVYCLQSHMIQERQWGPVVHIRDLATIAWLRTGLDAADVVPRGFLVGVCEQVLRVRPEVTEAVHQKLAEATPDKIPQYELMLSDQRSVRALMDQTFGDPTVVTENNVPRIFDRMRRAIVEEVTEAAEARLKREKQQHEEALAAIRSQLESIVAEHKAEKVKQDTQIAEQSETLSKAEADATALKERLKRARADDVRRFNELLNQNNKVIFGTEIAFLGTIIVACVIASTNAAFSWYEPIAHNAAVIGATLLVGVLSTYCLVFTLLGKPIAGIGSLLNAFGQWLIDVRATGRVSDEFIQECRDTIQFVNGRAQPLPMPCADMRT